MNSYPTNWGEIAHGVKEAAEWRCVRCGHPDDPELCTAEGVPRGYLPCDARCVHEEPDRDTRKRVLTVHHLDGDKANCRWWNLAALCQVCHLSVQGRVRMHQCWPFPHSEWFKPYVAGYYAWTVLGEHIGRGEVEERLEELLAIGQPTLFEASS